MEHWQLNELPLADDLPEILCSTPEARAVAFSLAAGRTLPAHSVREQAIVVVVEGTLEVETETCKASGGPGLVVCLAPGESHSVHSPAGARFLLLLAPWPAPSHPGGMTLQQKLYARAHAQRRR